MAEERIISVALNFYGAIVSLPSPARHHDLFHKLVAHAQIEPPILGEQGFLTSTGRFVNRREAFAIAATMEQMRPDRAPGGTELFSEDLW